MKFKTELVIATANEGKLKEFSILLEDHFKILTLRDFPSLCLPEEIENTYEGNARLKALYVSQKTGCFSLADDSGLEVDILDGEPGVKSARYCLEKSEKESNDQANNRYLLSQILKKQKNFLKYAAKFRTVLAFCDLEMNIIYSQGLLEGFIVPEAKGANGFGYDPLFWVESYQKTLAELTTDQKNSISHRNLAIKNLKLLINQ